MARAENSHKQEQTYVYIPSSPNMEHYFRIGSCFFPYSHKSCQCCPCQWPSLVVSETKHSASASSDFRPVCDFGHSVSPAWRERGEEFIKSWPGVKRIHKCQNMWHYVCRPAKHTGQLLLPTFDRQDWGPYGWDIFQEAVGRGPCEVVEIQGQTHRSTRGQCLRGQNASLRYSRKGSSVTLLGLHPKGDLIHVLLPPL